MRRYAIGGFGKPHAYEPHPLDKSESPPCMCGLAGNYRAHQPFWWRLLRPLESFR